MFLIVWLVGMVEVDLVSLSSEIIIVHAHVCTILIIKYKINWEHE